MNITGKIFCFLFLAGAALLFSSCQKKDSVFTRNQKNAAIIKTIGSLEERNREDRMSDPAVFFENDDYFREPDMPREVESFPEEPGISGEINPSRQP